MLLIIYINWNYYAFLIGSVVGFGKKLWQTITTCIAHRRSSDYILAVQQTSGWIGAIYFLFSKIEIKT